MTYGGAIAPHACLRVRHIAAELARHRGWAIDGELITVAAILHDIGLYPSASRGGVYTEDGAELAREMLRAHSWSTERIRRCAEAIDRHHELRVSSHAAPRSRPCGLLISSTSAVACSLSASIGAGCDVSITRCLARA